MTSFGRSAPVTTVPAGAVVVVVLDAGGSVVVELAVPAGSAVVDVVWEPGSPEGADRRSSGRVERQHLRKPAQQVELGGPLESVVALPVDGDHDRPSVGRPARCRCGRGSGRGAPRPGRRGRGCCPPPPGTPGRSSPGGTTAARRARANSENITMPMHAEAHAGGGSSQEQQIRNGAGGRRGRWHG